MRLKTKFSYFFYTHQYEIQRSLLLWADFQKSLHYFLFHVHFFFFLLSTSLAMNHSVDPLSILNNQRQHISSRSGNLL